MKRNFVEFLVECNGGAFALDCTDKMEELIKAVEQQSKSGSMTIELKVTPHGDGTASVLPVVKIKKPEKKRAPSVFFVHKDGLYANHPNQVKMFEEGTNVRSIEENRRILKEI